METNEGAARKGKRIGISMVIAASVVAVDTGCMTAMNNGDKVCGTDAEMTFNGFLLAPDEPIVLESAIAKDGPYAKLVTTKSDHTSGLTLEDGTALYARPQLQPDRVACGELRDRRGGADHDQRQPAAQIVRGGRVHRASAIQWMERRGQRLRQQRVRSVPVAYAADQHETRASACRRADSTVCHGQP